MLYSLPRYTSFRVNSFISVLLSVLLSATMPKLVRKQQPKEEQPKEEQPKEEQPKEEQPKEEQQEEEVAATNNNNDVAATYEMLNPRYANDSNILNDDENDPENKLKNRLGSYIEEPWTLIGSYFEGKHLDQLVRHQIESYNDMVNVQLKRTVDMFNPVRIVSEQDYDKISHTHRLEVEVSFANLYLSRPQIHENTGATKVLFPQEARLRNYTYASMMTVDMSVKYIVRNGSNGSNGNNGNNGGDITIHHKVFPQIQIGKLPIMFNRVFAYCRSISISTTMSRENAPMTQVVISL